MEYERLSNAVLDLVRLVSRLRGPGGCPWDARQTDETIKLYLIEEAYEVLDAIERGTPEDVCQELGDLLFQVIFLAHLADEKGEFNLVSVMEKIKDKMIKRHPHVFGETNVENVEEVAQNWAEIKKKEKGYRESLSTQLQNISLHLPALLRAHRLCERAAKEDIEFAEDEDSWERTEDGFERLRHAVIHKRNGEIRDLLGELLFCLVDAARHWGHNAENLLRLKNQKFIDTIRKMEKGAEIDSEQ